MQNKLTFVCTENNDNSNIYNSQTYFVFFRYFFNTLTQNKRKAI